MNDQYSYNTNNESIVLILQKSLKHEGFFLTFSSHIFAIIDMFPISPFPFFMKKISFVLPVALIVALSVLSSCTNTASSSSAGTDTTIVAQNTTTQTKKIQTSPTSAVQQNTTTSSSTNTTITPITPTTSTSSNTVSKTLSYRVPRGSASTLYSVTISGDTITQASASMTSGDHESSMYNSRFNRSLASSVIGKNISEIKNLSAIGGASLTTEAFTQFVSSL